MDRKNENNTSSLDLNLNKEVNKTPEIKRSRGGKKRVKKLENITSLSTLKDFDEELNKIPDSNSTTFKKQFKDLYIPFDPPNLKLIIMRGIPGSGKTTLARKIEDLAMRSGYKITGICSADDYFVKNGKYVFDGKKLGEAHKFCQSKAIQLLAAGKLQISNGEKSLGVGC